MAKLIVQCSNCQKDVEFAQEIDLSKPDSDKHVGDTLKNGTLCEVCAAEFNNNYDESCYTDGEVEPTKFQKGVKPTLPQIVDIPVPNLLAKQYDKELSKPSLAEFLKIIEAVGGILPIKRYNEVALPGPITEGEVPPPWPKLEASTEHVYFGNDGHLYRMGADGKGEKF